MVAHEERCPAQIEPIPGRVNLLLRFDGGTDTHFILCTGNGRKPISTPHGAAPGSPAAADADKTPSKEIEVTPQMVAVGVPVLYDLDGEVSKETLARLVFAAMVAQANLDQDGTHDLPKVRWPKGRHSNVVCP